MVRDYEKKNLLLKKKEEELEVRGKATGLKFWGAATKRCQRQEKGFSKQYEGAGLCHLVLCISRICLGAC